MDSQDHYEISEDRAEVSLAGPRVRPPATDGNGELGSGGTSSPRGSSPAQLRVRKAREQEADLDRILEEREQALTPEEALRYESKHPCAACSKVINTRHRFCLRCQSYSPLEEGYLARVNEGKFRRGANGQVYAFREEEDSYDCGCTSSSNPDVSAKDWFPPDPNCVSCRGTGRIRDFHRFMKRGRKRAAPDISIEPGSYEDAMSVVDSVMAPATEYEGYSSGNDAEMEGFLGLEGHLEPEGQFDFAAGGWRIAKNAPEVPRRPGEPDPIGRPPKGILIKEQIELELRRVLLEDHDVYTAFVYAAFDTHDPSVTAKKKARKPFYDIWTAKAKDEADINLDALSEVSGVGRSTVYKRADDGRKLGQDAPKGEGDEVIETEVLERHIDARFDQLEQQLSDEMNDVFRVLWAFRNGETSAEEWERVNPNDETE